MARLEDLTKGTPVGDVLGDRAVRVVDVEWHRSNAVIPTHTDDSTGRPSQELLYRADEARLVVEETGRAWSLDADGSLFRLVSEAKRISLSHLFDPFLAVQISTLDPLPHQIGAVYSQMLPRQPLHFLFADDFGVSKTIIAESAIAQLAGALDADVSITVEIEADAPKGFGDDIRRTVTENARTLKFDFHEFEESRRT